MVTAVPSRFAVLSIDDDECKPKKSQKTTTGPSKSSAKKQPDKSKQQPKKEEKKKNNRSKKKQTNNEEQQWEQWKQKDSMAVEETYEQDLQEAIFLSKLTYQAQLDNNGKGEPDQQNSTRGQGSKKSKKAATMSLEEFNNMGASASTSISSMPPSSATTATAVDSIAECKSKESDSEFFDRVEKEAKEEITKGKEKDLLKARLHRLDDNITSAQLKAEIEKRDECIDQLRKQVKSLQEELSQVKLRNKKLYQILSHGEMKDKASVLAEVAKLQEIRDELTSEVASLHAQLEQERSKSRTCNADVKPTKQNNKKRPASENA